MPTYDYECRKCGHRFEVFHAMSDETPKRCPVCKGRARKVPSAGAGLLFKGSGFYITDYRSESYKEKAKEEGAKPAAAEGGAAGATSGDAGKSTGGASAPASGAAGKEKKPAKRKKAE